MYIPEQLLEWNATGRVFQLKRGMAPVLVVTASTYAHDRIIALKYSCSVRYSTVHSKLYNAGRNSKKCKKKIL